MTRGSALLRIGATSVLVLAAMVPEILAQEDTRIVDRVVRSVTAVEEGRRPVLGLLGSHLSAWGRDSILEPIVSDAIEEDELDAWRVVDGADVDHWLSGVLAEPAGHATKLRALAADLSRHVVVDLVLGTPDGRIERGTVHLRPGIRAGVIRTRERGALVDIDPEIACDNSGGLRPSALGDPIVRTLVGGMAVDVRAHLAELPGQPTRITLDVMAQCGRFAEDPMLLPTRARFLGAIELPRYRGTVLRVGGTVEAGEALRTHVGTDEGRAFLEVKARIGHAARWGGPGPRRLEASLLTAPWTTSMCPTGASENPATPLVQDVLIEDQEHGAALSPDALAAIVRRASSDESSSMVDGLGGVWLHGPASDLRRVRKALARLVASRAVSTVLEVRLTADGETVGEARLPLRRGRASWVRHGIDQALILDADVEVG